MSIPHQQWDCAIVLLVLLIPEVESTSCLCPNLKPWKTTFITFTVNYIWTIFVEKKGNGLWLYINYHGLNYTTIESCYSMFLVPAALKWVRGAKYFIELYLQTAYILIRRIGVNGRFFMPAVAIMNVVLPYGLVNAPSAFQYFINIKHQKLLCKYLGKIVLSELIISWSIHIKLVFEE